MEITYVGPHDAVEADGLDAVVRQDESIDVPEDVAKGLLQQPDNWTETKPKGGK